MSIYLGIVGNETINCHLAAEVRKSLVDDTLGKNFSSIKYKKKVKLYQSKQ